MGESPLHRFLKLPVKRKHFDMRNLEKGTYITLVIGAFLDQLSTRIALTSPWLSEGNPYTRYLMGLELWLLFDIFFGLLIIGSCFVVLRILDFVNKRYILIVPYLCGSFRFLAGIWNLYLYLKVI